VRPSAKRQYLAALALEIASAKDNSIVLVVKAKARQDCQYWTWPDSLSGNLAPWPGPEILASCACHSEPLTTLTSQQAGRT
jgi:hypothetical protein